MFISLIDLLIVWLAVVVLPILVTVGIAGWLVWRQGYSPGPYLLLAWSLPAVSLAILVLLNLRPLLSLAWVAAISLILFLSLFLSFQQARLYNRGRRRADELEQRVARRTMELEEHQALLQALVQYAPSGILIKDRQGRYILVNERAAAYSGYIPEQMIGRMVEDLFSAEVARTTRQHDQEAINSREAIRRELVVPSPEGPKTFYTFRFPIFDQQGGVLGVGLFSLDITERKQIEATTHRLAEQRQYLLELSQSVLSTLTLAEVIEQVKQTSRKLITYSFLGLYELDKGTGYLYPIITTGDWSSEQMEQWRVPWEQGIVSDVIRSGQAELVNQAHLDPRSIYLEEPPPALEHALYVPFQIKGETTGAFVINRLTDPPFSQEEFELAQLYVTQIAIALHNARLFEQAEQARQVAEEANQAKSRFLANMSHELRTPLNIILGYAQLLKQEPALTPQQQAWLVTLHQSGHHLLTLINDILDLAKVEAGRVELVQATFRLPAFLKSLVEMIRVRAENKQIAFIFQPYDFNQDQAVDWLPAEIYGDETRLRQILINLLGNALKFTETGRVTFKVGLALPATGQPTSPKLRFQVEDTGPGIAPEHFELIFKPFQQLNRAGYQSEGTGLGLSISRTLLERMGSQIHVDSNVGQGSRFWFDLPLIQVSQSVSSTPTGPSHIIGLKGRRPRLMIVDDIAENRILLAEMLIPLGFEVRAVDSGLEALAQAPAFQPEAFIIDLVMPEMDGYTLARRLREQPQFRETLIIALSASVFSQDQQQSIEMGCNEFLAKPVEMAQLLAHLERYLRLEWLSAEVELIEEIAAPTLELLKPPPDLEIRLLHEMAMIGDISGILETLAKLEQADAGYTPFVSHLRRLTQNMELASMRAFIDRYLP